MINNEFRSAREAAKLTQEALAAKLGVSRNTVARWEMGMHPIPPSIALLLPHVLPRRRCA